MDSLTMNFKKALKGWGETVIFMFTLLSGFYVLDKKMSVNSTAEEDSGSKHSTDMGFCPL